MRCVIAIIMILSALLLMLGGCQAKNTCTSDSDCKLIYSGCTCKAVPVSDPRMTFSDGTLQCFVNGCHHENVTAVCRDSVCARSDQ